MISEEEISNANFKKISALLESMPLGLYIYRTLKNGSSRFDYMSKQCYELIGVDHESIMLDSANLFKTVHPDDLEDFVNVSIRATKELKQYSWEGRFIVGGENRWIRAESTPSVQSNGDIIWNGLINDITDRKKVEENLRESEAKFRELFEKSGDAILIIENENFIDCNQATVEMLGYDSKEEFLFTHPSKLSPEFQPDGKKSVSKANEMMETAIQNGTHRFEWDHVRKKGEVFPVEVLLTTISKNPNKRVIHTVWRDITERKRSEKSLFLRMHIERLSAEISAEFISHPISETDSLIYDVLKKIAEFSNAYKALIFRILPDEKIIKITHEWNHSSVKNLQLENIPFEDSGFFKNKIFNYETVVISHPDDFPKEIRLEKKFTQDFQFYSFLYIPILKQEKLHYVMAVYGDLEKEIHWTLEYIDLIKYIGPLVISAEERKETASALAAEKERLAVTLRSIGDGVITTDIEGKVLLMNNVAEKLCGWSQKDAIGQPLSSVFKIINEVTRLPCESPISKVLKSGEIVELEGNTVLISKDGTEKIIADSGAPIQNSELETIGVVLVFRDVTEKQKMQETIQKSVKLDSLGILAGGIAHDFNNLLSGIYGYIDLALEKSTNSKISSFLTKALNSIDRAKSLTSQLLTFAKGGAPVQNIYPLFPFVKEATQFALSGSNATCNFDIEKNLWQCSIDKNQISQVIDNIVINAQQAMPHGGKIDITAKNISIDENEHPSLNKGPYVRISFKDNGIGIPKEIITRIFDPYFSTKVKGHGLGLATCYSIINRHGGCIDVESETSKGTIFHIYLPASEKIVSLNSNQPEKKHIASGTILIMDDEEVMRDLMQYMLEFLGYKVISKCNGQDAVDFFRIERKEGRKFTCMFFDLTIPGGMGGKEAICEIRKFDRDIPVFVASGYAEDPVMADPVKYGFTASIPKPFTKHDLSELLSKHINVNSI